MSISDAPARRSPAPAAGTLSGWTLAALAACALSASAAPPPEGAQLTLRGRILPLAGASAPPSSAQIELRPAFDGIEGLRAGLQGKEVPPLATSPAVGDGSYLLSAAEPGCYRVTMRARGFRPLEIPLLPLVEPVELPPIEPVGLRPLSVQVLDPQGQPVVGIVVRAFPVARAGADDEPGAWRPAPALARTDAQGRATLERGGGEAVQVLAERADGIGLAGVAADAPWAIVRLEARSSATLAVRDVAGKPAAGALVVAAGLPVAEIDPDGGALVHLRARENGPLLVLSASGEWAEVNAPTDSGRKPVDRPVGPVEIRLLPPKLARGWALESATGKPLAGAVAWSGEGALGRTVRAGSDGRFVLPVAGSAPPTFGAAAAGHVWREIRQSVPKPNQGPVALRLDRALAPDEAGGITGIVVDAAGLPIAGAELFAVREVRRETANGTATERREERLAASDTHGGFHAGGLAPGSFDLVARANGYVEGRIAGLDLGAGGRRPDLKIALADGQSVEGQVRDGEDNPASGVTVRARRIRAIGTGAVLSRFDSVAVSERGGHFRLSGLTPGPYEVIAESPLGRARASVVVAAAPIHLDLRLGPDPVP